MKAKFELSEKNNKTLENAKIKSEDDLQFHAKLQSNSIATEHFRRSPAQKSRHLLQQLRAIFDAQSHSFLEFYIKTRDLEKVKNEQAHDFI